jgi:ATP-dependent RNA helicase RhlE
VLVFTRTKHRADRLVKQLNRQKVGAAAIHSNKAQNARQRTLASFAKGDIEVLVATDIVSRGIDVDGISHVINYDLPDDPENHVHRIGRTARAGAAGIAITFCAYEELSKLAAVERFAKEKLEVDADQPFHQELWAKAKAGPKPTMAGRGAPRHKRQRSRGRSTRMAMR